jgi:hypothetical protein
LSSLILFPVEHDRAALSSMIVREAATLSVNAGGGDGTQTVALSGTGT